jgi:hypothetical protein
VTRTPELTDTCLYGSRAEPHLCLIVLAVFTLARRVEGIPLQRLASLAGIVIAPYVGGKVIAYTDPRSV